MAIVIKNAKTVFTQILFIPEENPTQKLKTDSGLILTNMHKSEETGDFENSNQLVGFGIVTAVGPDVKQIKPGDGIYYLKGSIRPVPLGEETWNIAEQQVMTYVEADEPSLIEARKEYARLKEELSKLPATNFHNDLQEKAKDAGIILPNSNFKGVLN